jgi:hypothetical protein
MKLTNEKGALAVMSKARDNVIREIYLCGQTGSTARAANYASTLNHLTDAIHNLTHIIESDVGEVERRNRLIDKLEKARAAKRAKEVTAQNMVAEETTE